jgi:hypothetical protein
MTSRVFLDADVLASPVTRTLILLSFPHADSRFHVCWSAEVEAEANSHLRPGQARLAEVRRIGDLDDQVLVSSPAITELERLTDTNPKDKHVLAAASSAGAHAVVTRNVADFGHKDLSYLGMNAVHPDLFLARMLTPNMYQDTLASMCKRRNRPPNVPKALHLMIGLEHPLLAQAMSDLFPGAELPASSFPAPAELFRGRSCLICGKRLAAPRSTVIGIGPECLTHS